MSPRLSRKLVLEVRGAQGDGAGGRSGQWQALGTHWAQLDARLGRYETGDGYPRARVPYKVTIRSLPQDALSRPRAGQRFVEGDRVFLIKAVADEASDARYLVCYADEEIAA